MFSQAGPAALRAGRAVARPAARWGQAGVVRAASQGAPTTMTPEADMSRLGVADLCDKFHPESVDTVVEKNVQILEPGFRDYGGKKKFNGKAETIKAFENNPAVRKALEQPGNGKVLVVDGGASMRCALLGDNVAEMAAKNGWSGIIINGCIRDSDDISRIPIGVKALNTHPLKSSKRDFGLTNVPLTIAGAIVHPGNYIYADQDGIIVSQEALPV